MRVKCELNVLDSTIIITQMCIHQRAAEPPLVVMPITVWSPHAQSVEPPPSRVKELGRKHPEADGDGDSLLFNADLAASAISSVDEYLKYSFYPYDLVSFSSVFMLNKCPNALKVHTYDQVILLVELCKIGGKLLQK